MTLPTAATAVDAGKSSRGGGGDFSPMRIVEVELTAPLPRLDGEGHYGRAWILARLHSEPIGVCVAELPPGGLDPARLAAQLWDELGGLIAERFAAARAGPARPG